MIFPFSYRLLTPTPTIVSCPRVQLSLLILLELPDSLEKENVDGAAKSLLKQGEYIASQENVLLPLLIEQEMCHIKIVYSRGGPGWSRSMM